MNKFKMFLVSRLIDILGLSEISERLDFLTQQINSVRQDFNDQMDMVGIDVEYGNKQRQGVQTSIIFVSRLGPDKSGSVRVVNANFRDFRELRDFVKFCENSFHDRPVIDAAMPIGRNLLDY